MAWIKDRALVPLVSYIWKNIMEVKHWMIGNAQWEIGSGSSVEIDLDPIRCFVGDHSLPSPLIRYIDNLGI